MRSAVSKKRNRGIRKLGAVTDDLYAFVSPVETFRLGNLDVVNGGSAVDAYLKGRIRLSKERLGDKAG